MRTAPPAGAAVEAGAPARVPLVRGLNVAIDRRATCRIERTAGGVYLESKEALVRAEAARLDELRTTAALRPLARLLAALGLNEGVRAVGHGRVPAGAGLATDVALAVALAAAGLRLVGRDAAVAEVVRLASAALEDADGRAPVALDLWTAVRGGVMAERAPVAALDEPRERVPADPARVEEALLLADVGVPARPEARGPELSGEEQAVRAELAAVLAGRDDAAVPGLIARGVEATGRADRSFVTPQAAPALEAARALGGAGRPCGGGGGGLVVVWILADAREALQERLRALDVRTYPCRIDLLGLEVERT